MTAGNAARDQKSTDKRLEKELEDTFPASDPPSVLREPEGKVNGIDAARIDRRPPVTKPEDARPRQDPRDQSKGKAKL